jgi:DNA-binding CsgD family transcriptional regulator
MTTSLAEVVGRDAELEAAIAFLGAVGELPGAFVLEGEPGIGKTTLWRAAAAEASELDYCILTATPGAAETRLSFAALGDLFRPVVSRMLSALPPPQGRALAFALLLEEPTGKPPDQYAVSAAVLSSLRLLAAEQPLLLAIDDVQWLDSASTGVLAFASRRLEDERVALLLATRTGETGQIEAALARRLPPERLHRLYVGALTLGALGRILQRLGTVLPRPVLRRLHAVSGGNPFYALEIARALERRGERVAPGEPLPVPENLHDLVHDRLAELPAGVRELLLATAALSQPTVDLVGAALGRSLETELELAASAQVLEQEGPLLRFSHPLLATTVYTAAAPPARRTLHALLAEIVPDVEERARHLALATSEPSAEIAHALDAASARARARGAPAAAAELMEHALRLTPSDRSGDAVRRLLDAAGHHFETGDASQARALLERAVATSPAGATRSEALVRLARAELFGGDMHTAATLYRRALSGDELEPRIEAEARRGLAVAMMRMLEDLETAAVHGSVAAEIATRADDRYALAESLSVLSLIEGLLGRGAGPTMDRAEAAARAVAEGDAPSSYFLRGLWGPSLARGVLLSWHDRLPEARRQLGLARERAAELGDESAAPLLLRYLAYVAWLYGDWPEALRHAQEGHAIALQTGQQSQQSVLAGTSALVLAHQGRADEARRAADEALHLADSTGSTFATLLARSALGHLELAEGRPADAHAHLGPLLERLEAAGVREPGVLRFVPDQIEALIALARLDDADGLLATLERRAAAFDRPTALATARRCRALVLAASAESVDTEEWFEDALSHHERMPVPFERARTLLALGMVRRRARRKLPARQALEAALAAFEQLGARLWADRARAELARIAGRRRVAGLTPTERRVAELVAEGRSNKEVAAALFVAPKTVDVTLSRIYAKLGIHSRTELAARLPNL